MDKNFFDRREESEEEKYQFMKEQIRPQRKRKLIQYLKQLGGAVILAIVFGSVAGVAFVAMQNLMQEEHKDSFQQAMASSTSNAEKDLEEEETEVVTDAEFKEAIATLKDYQNFCEKAALVGERCNRYVVEIKEESEEENFEGGNSVKNVKSGVVFKETFQNYYILTDSDGISEEKNVQAKLLGDCEVNTEISGVDYSLDIAVLKVKREEVPERIQVQIEVAEFGEELKLKLNTPIIAIGNANGVFGSVELGNVIKDEMSGSIVDGEVSLYSSNIKYYKEGNGFITDIKGRIVGIISTSFSETTGESNCAFIGINSFLMGINSMVEGKVMPYFGVKGVDVTESVAEAMEISGGVYISNIISDSPAYKAKIRVADVIVKMDDTEIHSLQEMRNYLASCDSEDEITVWVKRSSGEDYVERKMKVVLK